MQQRVFTSQWIQRCAAVLLIFLTGCCDSSEIPSLTKKLNSSVTHDRTEAALSLARCGSKADGAVSRLAELLYDDNPGVQSAAAYALHQIGTPAAKSIMDRIEAAKRNK